jgi:hypothetical protein
VLTKRSVRADRERVTGFTDRERTVTRFPIATGPVLNQTPTGFSPPSVLDVYAPSRT